MLKQRFSVKRQLTRTREKFDGNTQLIRGGLIIDLKALAEMAHNRANDGRLTMKQRQKWAQLASQISRAVGYIMKDFDIIKIKEKLEELEKELAEFESERSSRENSI